MQPAPSKEAKLWQPHKERPLDRLLSKKKIAGLGNSVFHPADYAVLNAAIDPHRIGRAFALHTFTGNVGFTLAPATMILLSSLWGWRAALGLAGGLLLRQAVLVCGTLPTWNIAGFEFRRIARPKEPKPDIGMLPPQ